jgi:hypothetical protein
MFIFSPFDFLSSSFPGGFLFLVLSPVLVLGAAAVVVPLALLCSALLGLSNRAETIHPGNPTDKINLRESTRGWNGFELSWIKLD